MTSNGDEYPFRTSILSLEIFICVLTGKVPLNLDSFTTRANSPSDRYSQSIQT